MKTRLLFTTAIFGFVLSVPVKADTRYEISVGETLEILSNEYINNNLENSNGSTIYNLGGTINVADGTVFKNNTISATTNNKTVSGGVIFNGGIDNPGTITFGKVIFQENSAKVLSSTKNTNGNGGAISSNIGLIDVGSGSEFTQNHADTYGGAIHNTSNSKLSLRDDISFSANSAVKNGGAIYNLSTQDNTIGNNASFEDNHVTTGTSATTGLGGAIYNKGSSKGYASLKIGEDAHFAKNEAITSGGAVYNESGSIEFGINSIFETNKATGSSAMGGAISSKNGKLVIGDNATFENNESTYGGGAIWLEGENHEDFSIKNASFLTNSVTQNGGAIAIGITNDDKTVTIKNSTFAENTSENSGGAIGQENTSGTTARAKIVIDNTAFTNNSAGYEGGALTSDGILEVTNSSFDGNKVLNSHNVAVGGGAIMLLDHSDTTITNTRFSNNISDNAGGSIATRKKDTESTTSSLKIVDSTFEGNAADLGGGAIITYVPTTIINSTFNNNSADNGLGGAIQVANNATLELSGNNNFSRNTDQTGANDISNDAGIVNVSGNLTLDGGISGEGTTVFNEGSILTVNVGKTKIENNVINNGASVNLIFDAGFEGDYELVAKDKLNNEFADYDNNKIYTVTSVANGTYNANKKSAAEIAESLGISEQETDAVLAIISGNNTSNENFNKLADALNTAAQRGDESVKKISNLGADANPIVRVRETALSNMLFAAVSDELNNISGTSAQGMSAGDIFHKITVWARGLYNKLDYEKTAKASGFNGDTSGIAFGIDKEADNRLKAGLGYAYGKSDINSAMRDTDINTNTFFVYGKYKPADWHINTILAYSWSDYKETKSVLGYNANAKYDVKTFAAQAMYGHNGCIFGCDVLPEIGLRYLHIARDAYTDKLGTNVSDNDSDILTAVISAKAAKDFELERGTVIRPEIRAAVTYDLLEDGNNAAVTLANNAAYSINGEKFDRLGFELGIKATAQFTANWQLAVGYEARLRDNYNDNTWLMEAKYNF